MHPAPIFQHGFDDARAIAQRHPFAVLTAWSGQKLVMAQAPLIEVCDSDGALTGYEGHLARSNALVQNCDITQPIGVMVVFAGANAYVTPNAYPSKQEHGREVPTWNYASAELEGLLSFATEQAETLSIVERQTACFERELPNPWKMSDAPGDYIEKLGRAIIGFSISIERFEATIKLNQNKPAADFDGVANWLAAQDHPQSREIAALMHALERD